jgi:hypothetical protein
VSMTIVLPTPTKNLGKAFNFLKARNMAELKYWDACSNGILSAPAETSPRPSD